MYTNFAILFLVTIISCENENTTEIISTTTPILTSSSTTTQKYVSNHGEEKQLLSQSQQVNSKLASVNISKVEVPQVKKFKPSPQLDDIHFEYNRNPVKPAFPEAKYHASSPINSAIPWVGKQESMIENTWASPVRFPQTHPVTVNDHPYPFTKDIDKTQTVQKGKEFNNPIKYIPYGENWDIGVQRKPSKTYYEHGGFNSDLTSSPWKKVIKILTAFIPIGLLISALTPSVITITPVNGTYGKGRSDGGNKKKGTKLSNIERNGCEERILCELLLSAAETDNSEKSIDHLIDNYMAGNNDPQKLSRIYRAIKNGNCSSLHCDSIKN